MKSLLKSLARQGNISYLSYYFAEFIAEQSHCDIDSLLCYSAALVSENNQQGNVCIELDRFAGLPLFSSDNIEPAELPVGINPAEWQQTLLTSNCVGVAGDNTPLVLEQERLYLNRFWLYETRVAQDIAERLQPLRDPQITQLRDQLSRMFPDPQPAGIDSQKLAVALASTRRFIVISGGPGTGKTSVVIKILALLLSQKPGMRIKLAAPTGKAAARMMESIRKGVDNSTLDKNINELIPAQASTIHRLLGYRNQQFQSSNRNPLALDCLVVDEASMIDLTLMYRLLDAIPAQARVILLGDRDQLASVSAGNVLGDITGHGFRIEYSAAQIKFLSSLLDNTEASMPRSKNPVPIADAIALLTHSYRFSAESGIGQLADLINRGLGDEVIQCLQSKNHQLEWKNPASEHLDPETIDWVLSRYQAVVQTDTVLQAIEAFEQCRVLCAIHMGPSGVEEINQQITNAMHSRHWIDPAEEFRGKPILIVANDYELELFNGDTGVLWPDKTGSLQAHFRTSDQGIRAIPIINLPEHVPAWAMTVHKSQGSEFDSVLVVLPSDSNNRIVSRELLYTAVTRCSRKLLVYSRPEVLVKACNSLTKRRSGLAQKLGWEHL